MKNRVTKITVSAFTELERAVLYARVSGDDRSKEGRNLEGQLEMCREYATNKNYQVIEELAEDDKGASGYEIDLPELNKIRDLAHKGEFEVLVVRELDRLSRNLAKQLIIEEELKQTGVRIEYVLAEYDNTAEGQFQKHIRATVAEYEREKIKERMLRGKENASKRGKAFINVPPFGYDLTESQLIINEAEAGVVRLIYYWYISENETIYGICNRLDKMGVIREGKSSAARKRRNHAIGWTPDAVRRILASETYAGTFYYSRKKIPVNVPAIINKELFKLTQARLEENGRIRKPHQQEYLLNGLCKCGKCHNSYVAYTNTYKDKLYARYCCAARKNPKIHSTKCDASILKVDKVDVIVWEWLRGFLGDADRLKGYIEKYNRDISQANEPILRQIEATNALLEKYQLELNRLITAYQKGVLELEDIAGHRDQLKTTISKLAQERQKLSQKLSNEMLTPEEIENLLAFADRIAKGVQWADEHFGERRKLVKALRTKVIFTPVGERVQISVSCILDATKDGELMYDGS